MIKAFKMRLEYGMAFAALLALSGCVSVPGDAVRVGSYNIRFSDGDRGTSNDWDVRKTDLVAQVRRLDLDALGLQEVCPDQAEYLRANLTEFGFVGEHRNADLKNGEASPVLYRKSRFEALKSGTFWLSETPEAPGSKSWGTACPRVCTWALLAERGGRRVAGAVKRRDASALAAEGRVGAMMRKGGRRQGNTDRTEGTEREGPRIGRRGAKLREGCMDAGAWGIMLRNEW